MSIEPQNFVAELLPKAERATLVTLSGDLGAGKTTFVQGIAAVLGITETVTSPTFVIENVYALTDQKWKRLIHIDAYRLEKGSELEHLGWNEIVADPENLILLEWPEKVAEIIPEDAIKLRFDFDGEERIISRT